MPSASSWDVISDVNSNKIILSVDFRAAWRSEASFPELASRVGAEYRFLQTAPPNTCPDKRPAVDAYIQNWVQEAQQGGWQVAAVLGYCVGSVYAAAIAEGISQWQPAPKIVLFDPLLPAIRFIALEMYRVIGYFASASLLSSDEVERAKERTAELIGSEPGDIVDFAAALVGLYREIGSIAFGKLGLRAARSNEMIQIFESFMSWMSVADQIDPTDAWKRSTAIISADYLLLSKHELSAGLASNDLIGQTIPVDVPHNDLLRSDSAAKVLLEQVLIEQVEPH